MTNLKTYILATLFFLLPMLMHAGHQNKADEAVKEPKIKAFVRTIVSKNVLSSMSDTLSITYRLYISVDQDKASLAEIVSRNYPSSSAFRMQILRRRNVKEGIEVYKGQKYRTVDLSTMILSPRSEGEKKLNDGSISLQFNIPTGKKKRDMWGQVYEEYLRKQIDLDIEGAVITVMNMIGV